jgi:putative colanic acid biosynthesis UDP-glucose lipid carrier transferase
VGDWLMILGSYFAFSYWSKFSVGWALLPTIFLGLAFQFLGTRRNLYQAWPTGSKWAELLKTAFVFGGASLVAMTMIVIDGDFRDVNRVDLGLWIGVTCASLLFERYFVRTILRILRRAGLHRQRVAVVGDSEAAIRLSQAFAEDPGIGLEMYGHYTPSGTPSGTAPSSLGAHRGNLHQVIMDARQGRVEVVYLGLPLSQEVATRHLIHELADTTVQVHVLADFSGFNPMRFGWTDMGTVAVVSIFDSPFHGPQALLKRIEDVVVGTAILALISLPMLFISIGIKLTSSGPVFFRQRRYGLNGREIHVLKFRSMTVAEDGVEVKQVTHNDQRVTPFGGFLRRTSLDELPQFCQVFTGEMSIVGPRPHAVAHNEEYRSLIHGYMLRHMVKPGITGWAQVNGFRGETDTVEKMQLRVEHDIQYIRSWNLLLDVRIIWLTVFGRKVRENAY